MWPSSFFRATPGGSEPTTPQNAQPPVQPPTSKDSPHEIRHELRELNVRLSNFLSAIEELERKNRDLKTTLADEQEGSSRKIKELEDRLERNRLTSEEDIRQLQDKLAYSYTVRQNREAEIQDHLRNLQHEHDKQMKQQRDNAARRHEEELQNQRAQFEELQNYAQRKLEEELVPLRARNQELSAELAKLKSSAELARAAAELAELRQKYAQSQSALANTEARHAEQLRAVEKNLLNAESERNKYMRLHHDQLDQIRTIAATNEALLKEVGRYNSLLDNEAERILPSSKRRRIGESTTNSFVPIGGSNGTPETPIPTPVKLPETPVRQVTPPPAVVAPAALELPVTPARPKSPVPEATPSSTNSKREKRTKSKKLQVTLEVRTGLNYIVVRNNGDEDVAVGGWKITVYRSNSEYVFESSRVLRKRSKVHVWCVTDQRSDQDNEENVYWTTDQLWKSSDLVTLSDPNRSPAMIANCNPNP